MHPYTFMQAWGQDQFWGAQVQTPKSEPFGPQKVDFLNLTLLTLPTKKTPHFWPILWLKEDIVADFGHISLTMDLHLSTKTNKKQKQKTKETNKQTNNNKNYLLIICHPDFKKSAIYNKSQQRKLCIVCPKNERVSGMESEK